LTGASLTAAGYISAIVDPDRVNALAADWFDAWNTHDLGRILAHYREDVVFVSPLVTQLLGNADGRLLGKEALRGYFEIGLQRYPELRFEPISVAIGVSSVVLNYVSVMDRPSSELLILDGDGLVAESIAHYA
jgi:ketosteroid isomerase-like protein